MYQACCDQGPILQDLDVILNQYGVYMNQLGNREKLQMILDCTLMVKVNKISPANATRIEQLTRRLIFQLHNTRYKHIIQKSGQ